MTVRQKKIYRYMESLAKLYGALPWRQFIKVYNRYNAPKITKKEILNTDAYWVKRKTTCSLYLDMLVYNRASADTVDAIYTEGFSSAFYMPSEEEIEALSKPSYMPTSDAHTELYTALRRASAKPMSDELHLSVCVKLGEMMMAAEKMTNIVDVLHAFGIDVFGEKVDVAFFEKFQCAWNNTRMWTLHGFTPQEMLLRFEESSIKEKNLTANKNKNIKSSDPSNPIAARFYNLWYGLMNWLNETYQIVPPFPQLVYGKTVSEEPIIKLREVLWENPHYIDEYLASESAKSRNDFDRHAIREWRKKFVKGTFIVHRHLKNSSIFQAFDGNDALPLYEVFGLTNTIEKILGEGKRCPILVDAVLLPFDRKIVYDTMLATRPIVLSEALEKQMARLYTFGLDKYGVLKTL